MLSTTVSSWWLFLINNFLWSITITVLKHSHKLISVLSMRKIGRSLNLIDAFSLLKSENESILFCCRQQFFCHNFSLTTLVTHVNISCRRQKKLLMRKSHQLHFALSFNSLTQSRNCQGKLSSQWDLLDNCRAGGKGVRETFDSWKRGGINFSSSRPCYHCSWHACRIILLTRPIIVSKVLVKTSVFCCIGFIKSKCRPGLFNETKQQS